MKALKGEVRGKVLEVRFAFSGKVSWVSKAVGEKIVKGEHLASLDPKMLQADLDRQLADYDRIRAEFDASNESNKLLRQQKQSVLNVSVKDVEIAKMKLDQANLFSPVNGVIIEAENLVAGLNVTPANSAAKVLDLDSLTFNFLVTQDEVQLFKESVKLKVKFKNLKLEVEAKTSPLLFGQNGKFEISAKFDKPDALLPGLVGEATVLSS